ncbi:DMT family transporter [Polycladidibacter stylochi]|uniref:DMT family transporter n=1 Tax=Polycladidibacter stylochi TaxID=1807766 RepID=UPI00082D309E|nr:DMT family transporter [Pseudovibrio stylochi]
MSRPVANLLLLCTGLIWGMAFIAQSTAMESMGPLQFVGLRFLLAAFVILPLLFWEAKRSNKSILKKNTLPSMLAVGLCFLLGSLLQQYGIILTSVTNSGFLTAVYVVLTPILALLMFRQHPHPLVWVASLITLAGVYLLGGGSLTSLNMGDAYMLIGAVFWALQVILVGKLGAQTGRPIAIAFIQFLMVGCFATTISLFTEPISIAVLKSGWVELFFAGVCSGGIAFTLQAFAQQYTKPADAAIMLSSEALFAALFAALLLGERIPPIGLIGCALIFLAILMVEVLPHLIKKKAQAGYTS